MNLLAAPSAKSVILFHLHLTSNFSFIWSRKNILYCIIHLKLDINNACKYASSTEIKVSKVALTHR